LPPEFVSVEALIAQRGPQFGFGGGVIAPQPARSEMWNRARLEGASHKTAKTALTRRIRSWHAFAHLSRDRERCWKGTERSLTRTRRGVGRGPHTAFCVDKEICGRRSRSPDASLVEPRSGNARSRRGVLVAAGDGSLAAHRDQEVLDTRAARLQHRLHDDALGRGAVGVNDYALIRGGQHRL